ncbi:hypothetical protein OS493_029379 [Desmophyllum pertusum]|uniref:Gelsolin-like domain-containing protein n=1 Tax=Desmophyllum pertusum TaxID=174260 RepID=A0A9W9YWQ6_9CNID|nr:hypothetical protein OS493_029379 [Desmophyllum pertusum]
MDTVETSDKESDTETESETEVRAEKQVKDEVDDKSEDDDDDFLSSESENDKEEEDEPDEPDEPDEEEIVDKVDGNIKSRLSTDRPLSYTMEDVKKKKLITEDERPKSFAFGDEEHAEDPCITPNLKAFSDHRRKIKPARRPASSNPLRQRQNREDLRTETDMLRIRDEEKPSLAGKKKKEKAFTDEAMAGLSSTEDLAAASTALRRTAKDSSGVSTETKDFGGFLPVMLLHIKGSRHIQTRLVEPSIKSLNSGDVFVLVTPKEIHLWNGKDASIMKKAKAYVVDFGAETYLWLGRNCHNLARSKEATNSIFEMQPCEPDSLTEPPPEPSLNLEGFDVGRGTGSFDEEGRWFVVSSISMKIWHVKENSYQFLPEEEYGHFFSSEGYVVRWKYCVKLTGVKTLKGKQSRYEDVGRDKVAYFFWQGKDCTLNEKGTAALMTVELDSDKGPQILVSQGKEPPCFTRLFEGKMVVHLGKKDSQEENSSSSLRSRTSFVVADNKKSILHAWHGCKSPSPTKELAVNSAKKTKEVIQRNMITHCVFFNLKSTSGSFEATEVLCSWVDAVHVIYLWHGWWPPSDEDSESRASTTGSAETRMGVTTDGWQWRRSSLTLKVQDGVLTLLTLSQEWAGVTGSLGSNISKPLYEYEI